MLKNSFINGSKIISLDRALILGIMLGLGNYLTSFSDLARPIPLVTLSACLVLYYKFLHKIKIPKIPGLLYYLVPVGLMVAVARYYILYSENNMSFFPIIRHSGSLTLGLVLLTVLIQCLENISFQNIARGVVIGSIPCLIFGVIQFLRGHEIYGFTRIQSFFTEPSYYGEYLVLVLLPCLLESYRAYKAESKKNKFLINSISVLLVMNLIFAQSGTIILRLLTFLALLLFLYPIPRKIKIYAILSGLIIITITSLWTKSYVYIVFQMALDIVKNPARFFQYHTFYDRFYPIYSSLKTLPDNYFIGTGFGGDYFEFKNLYPIEVQPVLITVNPSLSFFFSFAPKFFLYFGLYGIYIYYYFFKIGKKCDDKLIMISFFAVLFSSFWSIANFSLPYIWFWLALILTKQSSRENRPL